MEFTKENNTEIYRQKLVTAEEAVSVIRSGDWVDYGWCNATVDTLDKALAKRTDELYDVHLRGGMILRPLAVLEREDSEEHFTWNTWHMSGIERQYAGRGLAYHIPIRYSEMPRYCRESETFCRIAMFQTAPMDHRGYFNFGPNASHMRAVCERAEHIIVEINRNMPYCHGDADNGVHISQVTAIVEGEHAPVPEVAAVRPTEVEEKIAGYVLEELCDGACLQLGIGGLPQAVGSLIAASDLKHLGVHTEMYVEALMDLTLAGKIDGSGKNRDRFRQTYTFAAGSRRLYDFMDHNQELFNAPVDYVNDVRVISGLDRVMSVNTALDMDLLGQAGAEAVGFRHISGAGGQLDFVMGAYLSPGGKSFLCLPSTYTDKNETLRSRILPFHEVGTAITTIRAGIQFVVTEYGKANLKGLTTWQRAEALIGLAHTDFREELVREAERMGIWRRSNRRG